MGKKVSIIVPVYGTEKYIKKCLNSLVNQTLKDIEIIVVNDGSKDNSEAIIKEYESNYKDVIRYYKKENGGLSDARNYGLDRATGAYIGFVDSDDYVELNMYEELYAKAKESDFDMVVANTNIVYPGNKDIQIVASGVNEDLIGKDNAKKVMPVIYPTVWNKIYKKEVIGGLRFTKGVWFEDIDFLYRLFAKTNSIGVCKKALYNYLQRENSITYTYNDKLFDFIHNMDNVVNYYKEKNLLQDYFEELEYLYARYALATFPKRLAKCKDYKKYNEGVKYSKEKIMKSFPNYRSNRYLSQVGFKGKYIKYFNSILSNINYIIGNCKKYN